MLLSNRKRFTVTFWPRWVYLGVESEFGRIFLDTTHLEVDTGVGGENDVLNFDLYSL